MKLKLLWIAVLLSFAVHAGAQNGSVMIRLVEDKGIAAAGDFCSILMQLVADAKNGFVKAKGREIEVNSNTAIWTSDMGIPGAVTSSLIFVSSWQYEGVIYQGASLADMKGHYDQYRQLLEDCMRANGYDETNEKNTQEQLSGCPELLFTKPSGQMPTVNLQAEYVENTGVYTLTVNVWQQGK